MPQPVKIGKKTRMSYAKIKEVAQMPHLLEIQNNSYKWFIEEGLKEVFEDISPINDYAGNLVLIIRSAILQSMARRSVRNAM